MNYRAEWPIEDQDARLTDLTDEATDDLHDMLTRQQLMIDGPIRWAIKCGARPKLTAECRVRVIPHTEPKVTGPAVEEILAMEPSTTIAGMAIRLGMTEDTLYQRLYRAKRTDLWARLRGNDTERTAAA